VFLIFRKKTNFILCCGFFKNTKEAWYREPTARVIEPLGKLAVPHLKWHSKAN